MSSGVHGMQSYDVVIVGAGPAGCTSALAFARASKRVLLLEADPRASDRLAGEWLHPPAVAILDRLGVDLTPATPYATGKGFVIFPCDGSEPIALPYAAGTSGLAIEHTLLVETLRAHCERDELIDLVPWARATRIDGQSLTFERRSAASRTSTTRTVSAPLIVGASGRSAPPAGRTTEPRSAASSRMAGIVLDGTTSQTRAALPFEGYLHVFLGGPGPVMAYRIDARRVRVLCDVPLSLPIPRDGGIALYEAYASVIPAEMRDAFRAALAPRAAGTSASPDARLHWASIDLRPRVDLGREGLALIGDAVGAHHPLAATDLTLAIEDAETLAKSPSFASYARTRARAARVPEMLAVGLYEVFADDADEVVAIRRAIYELWREKPSERLKSMGFLSGEDRSHLRFGTSFLRTMLRGSRDFVRDAVRTGRVIHTGRVASDLGQRMAWLFGGTLHLTEALPASVQQRIRAPRTAEGRYGAALR
nr:FAD-dependent oxidoreductase [Myxococcota bacterium]